MADEVTIEPYDPRWPDMYEQKRQLLLSTLGPIVVAIEHIGSTAVPGLAAKPIIDIALVVPSAQDFDAVSAALLPIGYRDWPYPAQRLHMKTTNRVRTHHVHAVGQHSDYLEIHRDFRDYLRSHPESAAAYER